jgi:hypothetical protein
MSPHTNGKQQIPYDVPVICTAGEFGNQLEAGGIKPGLHSTLPATHERTSGQGKCDKRPLAVSSLFRRGGGADGSHASLVGRVAVSLHLLHIYCAIRTKAKLLWIRTP